MTILRYTFRAFGEAFNLFGVRTTKRRINRKDVYYIPTPTDDVWAIRGDWLAVKKDYKKSLQQLAEKLHEQA